MADPRLELTDELLALCASGGWKTHNIVRLLVAVLRMHFADESKIEAPELQKKLWKADETTGILIEAVARWRPTLTEKRPAVLVSRDDVTVLRQGIDDRMMLATGPHVGRRIHATYLAGSSTIFCLAGEGAEAEVLAAEVYEEIRGFGPILRERLNLYKFRTVGIGKLAILEEASQNFVVPVMTAYAWEEHWEITEPTSAPLAGVKLTLTPDTL